MCCMGKYICNQEYLITGKVLNASKKHLFKTLNTINESFLKNLENQNALDSINTGMPQGSILGPLLYLLPINNQALEVN